MDDNKLTILWTNADPVASEMMVFMYAKNAMINNWWGSVKVVIWGATTKLVVEDRHIQELIKDARENGVEFSCCETCAVRLGVKEDLLDLDLEVKRWGKNLTELLKADSKVLSI